MGNNIDRVSQIMSIKWLLYHEPIQVVLLFYKKNKKRI